MSSSTAPDPPPVRRPGGQQTSADLSEHSPVMVLEKIETAMAGSADEGAVWAGAHVGFASQVK